VYQNFGMPIIIFGYNRKQAQALADIEQANQHKTGAFFMERIKQIAIIKHLIFNFVYLFLLIMILLFRISV
jgi:hypothetical protein